MKTINSIPHFGDHSDSVKTLQEILNEKEIANLTIDGIFGNLTLKAIKKFQEIRGLEVDGIIGRNTMRELEIELEKSIDNGGNAHLSWDYQNPVKDGWTNIVLNCIGSLYDDSFSKCDDISDFRSDYYSLTQQQRIIVWAELISAIAKFESNWKPICRYLEKTQGIDTVTNQPVYSEGLLQLSYQDKPNYSFIQCGFDWDSDNKLSPTDPNKSIFNPKINLEFGIKILAYQIRKRRSIALENGVYWSVIKKNGKYSKIAQISAMVNNLRF